MCMRFERSASSRKLTRKALSKSAAPKNASLKLRSLRSTCAKAEALTRSRSKSSDISLLPSFLHHLKNNNYKDDKFNDSKENQTSFQVYQLTTPFDQKPGAAFR